jgi:uncharacterized repeat protein (TIGR03806 family)
MNGTSRRGPRLALLAALAAAACGDGGGSGAPQYGLATRATLPALPLPTGLPQPLPVTLVDAFPALVFDRPVFLCAVPDGSGRVVVVEQPGRVRVFPNSAATTTTATLLDLTARVQFGGEEGLLGFAFHPDFAANGWLYVYYTAPGPRRSVISRFRISASDPNAADPSSEQVLLEVPQPFANHNSGALAFGPDGKLYVACGDGGSGNDPFDHGQDLTTILGSILRLNDDGSVPGDNPFAGAPGGARPEIWAYGLRNPWRMSFDRVTGALWAGDVGQGAIEEIDVIERGANYGWRVFEGTRSNVNPQNVPASAFTAPVHEYGHDLGASVTGGYVYRGSAVPALTGSYVYGDFVSGRIWALVFDGTQAVGNVQIATTVGPASFGEDANGELYVCCFDGRIRRFAPDASTPAVTAPPATLSATGLFADVAALTAVPGLLEYAVNAELWSDGATKRRWLGVPGTARIGFTASGAWTFPVGTVAVKHFAIDVAGGASRRLETRVLLHQVSGWAGFTYRWRADGLDADLVADAGETATYDVDDGSGGVVTRTWPFPSRAQCMQCHPPSAGSVLGVRTAQLNRDFAFPLRVDNQLRTWNHIGMFANDIGAATQYGALARPDDTGTSTAARARAWLDVNCANCHHPGGPTPVVMDLRAATAPAAMDVFGVAASVPLPSGSGVRAVAGDHVASEAWQRLVRRDAFAMPPLGSTVVDPLGRDLVAQWIDAHAALPLRVAPSTR